MMHTFLRLHPYKFLVTLDDVVPIVPKIPDKATVSSEDGGFGGLLMRAYVQAVSSIYEDILLHAGQKEHTDGEREVCSHQ